MLSHMRKSILLSPWRMILLSVLFTIAAGTLMLSLPQAQRQPLSFLDILFTAASATCVTGLLTIPLDSFTDFGHAIIMCLIQIGGLGLITLTVFFMSFFVNLGLGTQLMAGQVLELGNWKNAQRIITFIIKFTALAELIGTLIIFCMITNSTYSPLKRLFLALFHTIGSFNCAGLTLLDPAAPGSMVAFKNHPAFLSITGILVLIGGLGFITWREIIYYATAGAMRKRFHFSLHSKLVLSGTLWLTLVSSILFWLLEHRRSFFDLSAYSVMINTIFNALCLRSAGFTTFTLSEVHLATLLVILIIAFIGSSPGSTGSGIKITTAAIFLSTIKAVITGRTTVEMKGRRIANDQVLKSIAIVSLGLAWITLLIFFLLLTEPQARFIDVMFESFSAFTNLGLSLGLTPHLSSLGKLLIILSMIIGRIGTLTFVLAFKKRSEKAEFNYPEERVMIS